MHRVTDHDVRKCQFELVLKLNSQVVTSSLTQYDILIYVQKVSNGSILVFYSYKNSSLSGWWGMHPPSPVWIRHWSFVAIATRLPYNVIITSSLLSHSPLYRNLMLEFPLVAL